MIALAELVALPRIVPDSEKLVEISARLGVTLLVAFVVLQLAFLLIGRVARWMARAGQDRPAAIQRAQTLRGILRSLVTAIIVLGVVVYGLQAFGWDVRPLLAGAGILGVALGFGAQTLVRDVIAGVFILAEDQFGVGDLIEVNGRPATVEDMSVRCTRLRDFNGFVHFVPNGELKTVVNRSRGWHRLTVDVPVATDQDLDAALATCRATLAAFNADRAWAGRLLDPAELWGVEALNPQEAIIRVVLRGVPGPDVPESARELRRRLLEALGRAGIRLFAARDIAIGPHAGAPGRSASSSD